MYPYYALNPTTSHTESEQMRMVVTMLPPWPLPFALLRYVDGAG